MQLFYTPLAAVLSVYLVIAIGMICRKTKMIEQQTTDSVVRFVVNVLMPCLIFSKVLSNEAFHDVRNIIFPPLTGIGVILIGIVVAWIYGRCLPKKWTGLDSPKKFEAFIACVGMLNYGYVPIPLAVDLYPDNNQVLAVLFVQNIGAEFMLWTAIIFCFMGAIDRASLKKVINPPVLAIIGTMAMNLTGLDVYVPAILRKTIEMIGVSAIPISLLFVGATIADQLNWKEFWSEKKMLLKIGFGSCFLRLFILPALIIFLAKYIPCSRELKIVLVVHAAMASAIFPIVLARIYHGDTKTAIVTVFSNSFPAIVTTPLWIAFGLKYLQL